MPAVVAEPEIEVLEKPPRPQGGGPGGGGPRGSEPGDRWGRGDGDGEPAGRGPERGPSAGMLGVLAMMVSITTLFVTIVLVFMVRARSHTHWNHVPIPSLLWASTALIIASGWTFERARRSIHAFRPRLYLRWLTLTFFLGLGFVLSQALSLRQLVMRGVYLRANPHSLLFYVVTGVHGFHLFGGILALFYLLCRAAIGFGPDDKLITRQSELVRVVGVYWHFLDALWVALFVMLLAWN